MDPTPERSLPPIPGLSALEDLPTKGADAVDAVVDFVKVKAVRPIMLATRAIVFGAIVLTATVIVLTLVAVTSVRILTVYLPGNRVWVSDLIVGAVFVLLGTIAWMQRVSRGAAGANA